jgi:tRNA threonylcarbamoyladenosine biosynthesis protein TsaB
VVNEPRVHAAQLVPTIRGLAGEAGLSMSDLAAVAVSKGPGSFTGLRIGVSTAKGICYGLGVPLIGVQTFEAMAFANHEHFDAHQGGFMATVVPSRRGEAYWQIWKLDVRGPQSLDEARSDPFAMIVSEFQELSPTPVVVLGQVPDGLKNVLEDGGVDFSIVPDSKRRPTIEGMVALGTSSFDGSKFEDVADFEPYYLKEFVAKKAGSPFDRLP